MTDESRQNTINWYRSPVERDTLRALSRPSDLVGLFQTLGYLGLLALTGGTAWYAAGRWPWAVVVLLLFVHGTFFAFMINGFHELVHDTVFRTRWLNRAFLWVFSFLGWHNHIFFWSSHTEHHKYTLHPPADLEVVLPHILTVRQYLTRAFVDVLGPYGTIKAYVRQALGKVDGEWGNNLFPESKPVLCRKLRNWARILLVGHASIIGVSIYMQWWMLPIVMTFARFYGMWLFLLCNNTQHMGLSDNVPDFRLCCRTIILNPFTRFLYWHMNYHTEHHMYAAVPCYNLGKLHKLIKHDLPHCPRGLIETWRQIAGIRKKQKIDPEYQYVAELPSTGAAAALPDAS
ncbi:MAG: fatty acid desaturase [Phycisphaerae bacterium]|nr:fatty acid desaturase [Phycisphaerae bacterium]